jgi:hypothetical protein
MKKGRVGTASQRDSAAADRAENRADRLAHQQEQDSDKHTRQAEQDALKHQGLRDKFTEPLPGAIDNADAQKTYADGKVHTGTSDYQMMLQFQESIVAGQKAGIRFNTAEQARIEHAQNLMNSLRAKWGHMTGGTYFSDEQRHEIAAAMQNVADVHKKAIDRWDKEHGGGGQGGTRQSGSTQRFTDNGVTYNIPADKVDAFKKAHPSAK